MKIQTWLRALIFVAACFAFANTAFAAASTLPPHPRLIATMADWQNLAERRKTDPELNNYVELMLDRARADLKLAPVERTMTGRRLLSISREFIRRTLLWAFAYRVTGEAVFLERARREMLAVSDFSDWNPSHYLDVAEMSAGLALGYDWLYHDLSPADRKTLRTALIDMGIAQARNGHKTFRAENNWGQVCIGGMVLGALAIEEDEPALAADLLAAARKDAFIALGPYKPHGVYPEGPSYWVYGTTYQALLIAALRSSLNTDWGLMDAPGLKQSAEYYAQSIGPTGKAFNFADGGEGVSLAPPLFYFARELNQPTLLDAELSMIKSKRGLSERFAPLIALWWPKAEIAQPAPLSFYGQGPQPVAIWRSAWNDRNAFYFGIKAGGGGHNHAHLDGGSFVLDLDGVRWAKDLGMQDYNSLESKGIQLFGKAQNAARWTVFRLVNVAHNTLTIGDTLHNVKGMASLQMVNTDEALIDLAPIFQRGQLKTATRRATIKGQTATVVDEISGAESGSVITWRMNTEAAITLNGNTAVLTSGGKTLHVRFSGGPQTLSVVDISQPRSSFDHPNKNTRQLVASAPAGADGKWQISVSFSRD